MKNCLFILIFLVSISVNVHANKRTECLEAVNKGKEIMDVNDMKIYSYKGKTYTFRDKSDRCFERYLR